MVVVSGVVCIAPSFIEREGKRQRQLGRGSIFGLVGTGRDKCMGQRMNRE